MFRLTRQMLSTLLVFEVIRQEGNYEKKESNLLIHSPQKNFEYKYGLKLSSGLYRPFMSTKTNTGTRCFFLVTFAQASSSNGGKIMPTSQ
jgi:hypothetical protein